MLNRASSMLIAADQGIRSLAVAAKSKGPNATKTLATSPIEPAAMHTKASSAF